MDNPDRVTYFAATDSRGKRTPFGIKSRDRQRHMYVIGKTGMGKSTLLENLAIQDIRNGEGMAFIDPHGSAVETLLDYIPKERVKDVVYFAPFDLDNPIAFNVMEDVGYDKRHLVVSGLMATFKKIWVDAWSARMEYILSNTLLALLEYPGATLLGVNRMYTDKGYRKLVIDNVKDPIVKEFWTKEFATYTDRYTQEATPAIQNKVGQFTSNPLIRNIIGQSKSSFDIRTLMDEKKILLINLSKGLVGDTNMRLLGSMLVTRIFLGAMSRANLPERELKRSPNFYLYVDEFQNFANDTFSEILSEARKYNLNLLIAHQYVEQMEEAVRNAVFGNVGTTVAFRVGPFDAEVLETIFTPEFTKEDLVNLGFAQIYLSLMIDGVGSRPFSATTIPLIEAPETTYRTEVIAASREQFSTSREDVEKSIMSSLEESVSAELPDDARTKKRDYRKSATRPENTPPMRTNVPRETYSSERPQQHNTRQEKQSESEKSAPRRPMRPAESATKKEPVKQRVSSNTQNERPALRMYEREKSKPTNENNAAENRFTSDEILAALLESEKRRPRPKDEQNDDAQFVSNTPNTPAAHERVSQSSKKTGNDFRATLRSIAEKANKQQEDKKQEKADSLKSTLADILKKHELEAPQKKPEIEPPPKEELLEPQPFEVPEKKLRQVLKGET